MVPRLSLRQLGLCATCNDMELCTSRKTWVGPVIQCEHFDDSEPRERAPREIRSFPPSEPASSKTPKPTALHRGLCVNCNARDYCGLPTPGTVVLHCEEYGVLPLRDLVPEALLPPFKTSTSAAEKRPDKTDSCKTTDADVISTIVQKHEGSYGAVIGMLEEIQGEYGYLPQDALVLVAETTKRPLVDIFGIATFYRSFSLKPRGKHLVSVCLGTACHVRGAPLIVGEFEERLGVKQGETTDDYEFTLETVNCLGACALGPVVVAGNKYFSKVRQSKVHRIIKKVGSNEDARLSDDPRVFPLDLRCPNCGDSLLDAGHLIDDHPSVHLTASFEGRRSWIRLSSLYGSYAVATEHEIPVNALVAFSCPHCAAELTGVNGYCPECDARMLSLAVAPGGTLRVCARHGCKSHMLDLRRRESTPRNAI